MTVDDLLPATVNERVVVGGAISRGNRHSWFGFNPHIGVQLTRPLQVALDLGAAGRRQPAVGVEIPLENINGGEPDVLPRNVRIEDLRRDLLVVYQGSRS